MAEKEDFYLSNATTILIVEDDPDSVTVIAELLAPFYNVRVANSGPRALELVQQTPQPDLILLDIMMPEMDGFAVTSHLKAEPRTKNIPIIFLTAMDSISDETKGLALGAVDYITKPIRPAIVLARVEAQLELKRARDLLRDQNTHLEAEISRRMAENEMIQDVTIRTLARLAEMRDSDTGQHILRTSLYVKNLALLLQKNSIYSHLLSDRDIVLLSKSAPLLDIGKVGIPDRILMKPDRLTDEEWVIMKTHSLIGAQSIEAAEKDINTQIDFLTYAKEIAHWHHEKWDGSGYPDSLSGQEIPLSARLMALADVFDALMFKRVYKAAFNSDAVRDIIIEGRGQHFDPVITDIFLENYALFVDIATKHLE